MTEPLDVGLPADHRLAGRASVGAADVVGETWIGVPDGYPFERILHEIEQQAGGRIEVVQRISDIRMIEALIMAGLGIALVPRYTSGGSQPGKLVLKHLRRASRRAHSVRRAARPGEARAGRAHGIRRLKVSTGSTIER
jgi:DNA-binding transcriptional LysR family regulator